MAYLLYGQRGNNGQRIEEFRRFMTDKHTLEHTLGHLFEKIKQREGADSDLLHDLKAADKSFARMNRYIRRTTEVRMLCHEYCPPHAQGLAQKVFDIPELLEEMLMHLSVKDLLGAQCVNRQFRDAVDSSIRLQRQLTFSPSKSKFFFSPFDSWDHYCGLMLTKDLTAGQHSSIKLGQEHELDVSLILSGDPPKLGSKCRRILLVQPRIKRIRVNVQCCYGEGGEEVYNPKGITIGDVVDRTEKMQRIHRYHMKARSSLQEDMTTEEKPKVFFRTKVLLQNEDPILAEWREREKERDALNESAREEQSREDGHK